MSAKKRRRTADELIADLERRPDFVARQIEQKAIEDANRQLYAAAVGPLLDDLADAGFKVSSLAELRKPSVGNLRAVPSLARWLSRVAYPPVKLDVIATLGSSWARPLAAQPLLEEFRRNDAASDPRGEVRWAVGDALERVADESALDGVLEVAKDSRQGHTRALVVAALGNMTNARERVVPVLRDLLNDDDIAPYAVMALGKLRAGEARSAIEPFLDHPDPWVRREAKKALARLPRPH